MNLEEDNSKNLPSNKSNAVLMRHWELGNEPLGNGQDQHTTGPGCPKPLRNDFGDFENQTENRG